MIKHATFSPCGKFRQELSGVWDDTKPLAVWVLANPSIASDTIPDPTWTKGVGFSQRLGYGGQIFVNVFDYIATDPTDLKRAGYPRSPDADTLIVRAALHGDGSVICAWGAVLRGRPECLNVARMLDRAGFRLKALGFTDRGEPRHPLMLAYKTPLEPWQLMPP